MQQFLLAAGLAYEKSSRSTNMAYTQMLFALTFDKLVFNHSPGWISIIGSSLILGPAIIVALQKDAGNVPKHDANVTSGDEESHEMLLSAQHESHELTNNNRIGVQDVEMRDLR